MPTLVFNTGREQGVLATQGGGLANSIVGTVGVEVDVGAGYKRSGSYGLKCAPTASTGGRVTNNLPTAGTSCVRRFYIYIVTAPSTATWVSEMEMSAGSYPRLYLNPSGTVFEIRVGTTLVQAGPTYTTGVWYRVDWKVDSSTNPMDVRVKIDGGTEFGGTFAQASSNVVSQRNGNGTTTGPAFECWYDDECMSVTLGDYPIGEGQGGWSSPDADGTHSPSTPDCIRGGGASPALISGSNAAYQYMDDVPFPVGTVPTTDRINKDTSTAHTAHYVEMTAQDVSGSPTINGVSGLLAYGGDSATANNGSTITIDGDANETAIHGSSGTPADMSENSAVFFKRAPLTIPAGGWNSTKFNAIKFRIGYSTDVSPNPFWQALGIEYDFVAGGGGPTTALQDVIGVGMIPFPR